MSVTDSTERYLNTTVCQRLREYLFHATTIPDQLDEPTVPKVIILKTSQTADPRKSGLGKKLGKFSAIILKVCGAGKFLRVGFSGIN